MEEKKLTDEEIVKALKVVGKETLAFAYDKEQRRFEYVTAQEILDLIHRQKAEIKRLNKQLKHTVSDMKLEVGIRDRENAELQNQVDELKASREIEINELHEQHAIVAEEIKKDTAKEIFAEWENNLDDYIDFADFIDKMKAHYGVEVE